MTGRKTKTVFCRFFVLVAAVVIALLSWLAVSFVFAEKAHAEGSLSEHDEVFGTSEDHGGATPFASTGGIVPSGNYYLTDDIVLTKYVDMFNSEDIKLCLHGHSITLSSGHLFEIYTHSTLSIYDCGGEDGGGCLRGGKGVLIMGGTLNLYGGAIKDASGGYGIGGGVSVSGNGVFNMYGGAVTGNQANGGGGGGVGIGSSGTFNMYGGTISNNTVTKKNGAGVNVSSVTSTFNMYGGTITNNVINCDDGDDAESYHGAGVYVNGGSFSVEGDVVISGNVRGTSESPSLNNVELGGDGKIEITGPLGENAHIGITAPEGAFTSGYSSSGNTQSPSAFFSADDGTKIDFDAVSGEGRVTDEEDDGSYHMVDARVEGHTQATVGDTEITFTVKVRLRNSAGDEDERSSVFKVELDSPLHSGDNLVSFTFDYNGETKPLSYTIVPKKLHVNVL